MAAGLYDKVVTIQRPQTLKNDFGEETVEYVDKYQVRARIVHQTGSVDVENGEILHNYRKKIEMYRFIDIRLTDYLKFDDNQFRVIDIDENRQLNKKTLIVELVND